MKNYYQILGITQKASFEEIKQAYRKLSKKIHPDVNGGDKFFENMFKDLQEANEILCDEAKRKNYDSKLIQHLEKERELKRKEEELRKKEEELKRKEQENTKQQSKSNFENTKTYQQTQKKEDTLQNNRKVFIWILITIFAWIVTPFIVIYLTNLPSLGDFVKTLNTSKSTFSNASKITFEVDDEVYGIAQKVFAIRLEDEFSNNPYSISIGENNPYLALINKSGSKISFWNIEKKAFLNTYGIEGEIYNCISYSKKDSAFYVGKSNSEVLAIKAGAEPREINRTQYSLEITAISNGVNNTAITSLYGFGILINTEPKAHSIEHTSLFEQLHFVQNDLYLIGLNSFAAPLNGGELRVYEMNSASLVKRIEIKNKIKNVFTPILFDNYLAIVTLNPHKIEIWDLENSQMVDEINYIPACDYIYYNNKEGSINLVSIENEKKTLSLWKIPYNPFAQEMEKEMNNSKLNSSKNEFETQVVYQNRLNQFEAFKKNIVKKYFEKIKAKRIETEKELVNKIAQSQKGLEMKIDSLSLYDAENQTFTIKVNGQDKILKIPIQEAKSFKENLSSAKIIVTQKLKLDLKTYEILNYKLIHPVSKVEYFLK